MNPGELLRRLEDLGIDLTLWGDRIRYRGAGSPPPPDLLAEMKQHRDALVSILSRRQALQWPPRRSDTGDTDRRGPLTWAQRKVWATNFFRDDGTYNLSGGLRIIGPLNLVAFEAALGDLYRRHPSLRTVFAVEHGMPTQRIIATRAVDGASATVLHDFTRDSTEAAFQECLADWQTVAASRLPLDQTPPVRTRLYRLADEDHVFAVVMHHVIADGVSVRVLIDDLARCYNARVEGGAAQPPARQVDMIDCARFEEAYLQCADLRSARRYWENVLRGGTFGALPLPPRLVSLDSKDIGGPRVIAVDIVVATTASVRQVAATSRSTPFLVVSAAIASMLSRFTGRDDIVVGMPVARRDRPGLSELVGLLLDMVPIRLAVGDNPTFLELVQRTRAAVLGAVRDAVVAVELCTDDPGLPHAGQMFNVVLTDNGTNAGHPWFRDLEVSSVDMAPAGAKFDLNFLVRDDGDTLHIDVEFDTRVLSERDALAMIAMAQEILAQAAASPASRVLDAATAPAISERAADGWAAPRLRDEESLFSRLAAVAALRGDAVAIADDGIAVSYRSFYDQADQVARGLRQQGLGQGDVVAITLPRGIDLVVAMVGVMGCGAACLVLDDAWPQARVEHVLRDANVGCIIAAESDPAQSRVTVARLTELGSTAKPTVPVPSSSTAYLIYTSGSTGQPKGVQVRHRNVLSLLDGTSERFGFDASDTWTLFHACSFDFSIWEIFGCLLTGGKLVVVPKLVTWDPEAFVQLLRRERVTVLNLTPSALWASMTAVAGDPSAVESVRYLIFGGEPLHPRLLDRWYREVGDRTQLVNMYGITETTVHTSWRWLEAGPQPAESDIGRALPETSLYLLYDNGRPVNERCVGEIYVGGAGVAVGYLRRPRETAVRFVPDPFTSTPGSRMYRSGDLGRRNGPAISYLGRRDSQVKVNGFRIELNEVEAALVGQPGVAGAAAATAADECGTIIVAVVVADAHTTLSPGDLMRGARNILPRYMVPSSVTVVPKLPLTANGKLDRAAVVAARIVEEPVSKGSEPAPPQGSPQALLLELFRDVLRDPSVSTATDFFDRGGDSMRAIRLVSLARDRGLVFSVRDVYATPRLKELAGRVVLQSANAEPPPQRAPFSLLKGDVSRSFDDTVEDAYPMTALQLGMMYLRELAPAAGVYHIVLSYRVSGHMNPDAFRSAAQIVTDMHPILRTSFDLSHPSGPIQRVHSPVAAPVEFEDLRHTDPADQLTRVTQVVERERTTEFDLTRPALFRLVVLTLSDTGYQLLFTHHHAILDGWSVNVFFEDLHTSYMGKLAGESAPVLRRLPNVFADYVALEQGAMEEPTHLDFWQARTSPESGLLAPNRWSEPVMRQVRVDMPDGMIAELRSVASGLGVPVKALLLAAHVRVIAWLTGNHEVVTGQVVNCRPETRDSDRMLGLFLNQYPMRIQLRDQTGAELAEEVHLDEQSMMPHRWYPHALIQQQHGPRPIFDNYFNFTDFHTTRRLVSEARLDILDVNELESTHYALGANYTVDVRTGELRLVLEYDESVIPRATATLVADAHVRALGAMLVDPHAPCLSAPLPSGVDLAPLGAGGADATASHESAGTSSSEAPAALRRRRDGAGRDRTELMTPLEHSVQRVWIEVLGAVEPGVNSNFFDIGGTSLKAMRVVSRLRALHGPLSMGTFMEAPTIADLARSLRANDLHAAAPSPPTAISAGIARCVAASREYPLTRAQEHLWQLANELPGVPLFGMPGALRVEGPLDLDVLEHTFEMLVDRHAALRTRIAVTDSGAVQLVEPSAELHLETIDLRTMEDAVARCEQMMALAVLKPMELTRSPLARAIAFQIADGLHVIYLNIHHIVCDAGSLAVLVREAAQIYHDVSCGADVQSARRPLGSGEVAQAEVEWTRSPAAAAQQRYWVERLAPPWSSLAGSGSRFGPPKSHGILERLRAATCRRRLPRTAVELLRTAARRHGMTEFMVFLTAFGSTLRAWSGQRDIRIATMMANRTQPERESVVGLLANTVILRLNVAENHDLVDLSIQTRRVCLDAYDRQELPFEDVIAALKTRHPEEDGFGRLFEAMLLMQEGTPAVALNEGFRWSPYTPERGALAPPIMPTTCDFVVAATPTCDELLLDLQYTPATTDAAVAEALLDDVAVAIGATARALVVQP